MFVFGGGKSLTEFSSRIVWMFEGRTTSWTIQRWQIGNPMESAEKKNATRWNYSDSGIDNFLRQFFRPDLVEAFFWKTPKKFQSCTRLSHSLCTNKILFWNLGFTIVTGFFCSFWKGTWKKTMKNPREIGGTSPGTEVSQLAAKLDSFKTSQDWYPPRELSHIPTSQHFWVDDFCGFPIMGYDPVNQWDKPPTSTGAGFLPSTVAQKPRFFHVLETMPQFLFMLMATTTDGTMGLLESRGWDRLGEPSKNPTIHDCLMNR